VKKGFNNLVTRAARSEKVVRFASSEEGKFVAKQAPKVIVGAAVAMG